MEVKIVKNKTTYNISFNPEDDSLVFLCNENNHPATLRLVIINVMKEKYSISIEAIMLRINKTK